MTRRLPSSRSIGLALAFAAAAVLLLGASCRNPQSILITSPVHGSFINAGSVLVTGKVGGLSAGQIVDVTVNGVSVLPLAADGSFTTTVTLDPSIVFNPILAEVVRTSGLPLRHRVSVVVGDSVADGDFSPMGVALRLNDTGLDEAEPVVASLVDLDLATLVPPGTLVIDNYCYEDVWLIGCIGRVDVTISGTPPPSVGGFGIAIDSMTDQVAGDITLTDLFVRANVDDATGVPLHCEIDINAGTTTILGDYGLSPDAIDPSNIDVTQLGGVSVGFGAFSDSTNCSGLLGGLVELLVGLFIGDVQDLMRPALENFLNTVDANNNTPVAGAIETALADIEISGPIGQSLGVNLETPLYDVFEDVDGITLDSDARITASQPLPGAPDFTASHHVDEPFPAFGPTTPVGALPYDMAIAISSSAFNQLLKAEVESGLLITQITEFDLGGGLQPLTAGLLALLVPEFSILDPSTPLRIDLAPTLAPVVTGQPGPFGELNELRIGHLRAEIVIDEPDGALLLRMAIDVKVGLDVTFDSQNGTLAFTMGTLPQQNLSVVLLQNNLVQNEPFVVGLVQALVPSVFPSLADSLGSFPLPDFLGLQLGAVEVSKSGEFTSLFFDLSSAP